MTRALVLAAALLASMAGMARSDATAKAQERPWTPLPDPISATCPGGICQAEGLGSFFAALDGGGPVRVIQFGDSHTAAGEITGAVLRRLQAAFPGRDVRVDALGGVGDTLNRLETREPLFDVAPDLVILAYGTNEGFDDRLDPSAYEGLLRAQIRRASRLAPGASLLILGAPEAMRSEGGGPCPDDAERRWRAPAMLAVVRDVQRRVAAELGVAFWDWKGRMGGDCSAHALTLGPEPLMRPDHVHFTSAGGDWIGSLLFDDLMAAHARRGRR